jgi:hypothetical protein
MTTPTTVPVRLQLRADTAANWTSVNPILLANELGRETDTGKIKIGNGTSTWTSLAYQAWATLPVAVNAGGTGQTSYTNGQLLIGNTTGNTLTKATLTAGSGVAITNGTGSITVAASGIANTNIAANAEIAVSKLQDGTARQLLQTAANGTDVEWASNIDIPGTLDVTGNAVFDANLTVQGDLTVNGTETIINTQTLTVEDKNIELGKITSPTDVTADGGGITLKGTTDKTINWIDATDAWTLSEHVDLATGKEYRINGAQVLTGTALGSGVTGSSLTSVGTISSGTWQGTTVGTAYGGTGQTTYTNGELLIGKTDGTLAKATLTAGTGVAVTNADGSITVAVDSTVVTTSDTGTVTSTMIADGTIVDADVNASAAIAGTKISPDFGSQNVVTTGTSTAASLIPTGSSVPTNGVYLPAANSVGISTNGTGRLFVDASGNVGVGITSPAQRLHISSGANTTLRIADSTGSHTDFIYNDNGTTSAFTLSIDPGNTGNDTSIRVNIDGAERARIRADGMFEVKGAGTAGTSPAFSINGSAPSDSAVVDSNGRLGLGTSAPDALLHLSSATGSATPTPTEIRIATTTNANNWSLTDPWGRVSFYSQDISGSGPKIHTSIDCTSAAGSGASSNLFFKTSSNTSNTLETRLMIVGDSGNVGIGTTSPDALLTVNGIGAFGAGAVTTPSIAATGDLNTGFWFPAADTIAASTGGSERARIDSSGRLLVGDTASQTLEAAHRIQVSHAAELSASFTRYATNAAAAPAISFGKSNSATIGTQTLVANGEFLGRIRFLGSDGVNLNSVAAEIISAVDGVTGQTAGTFAVGTEYRILTTGTTDFTLIGAADSNPGTIFTATDVGTGTGTAIRTAGDMPGRLVFSTTPDNTGAPVERARITNTGALLVGTTATPTGAGSGAVVAQDRVVISAVEAGRNQIIVDNISSVTATTGTVVFKFKGLLTAARACYVKLAISQRAASGVASDSPAAEYAFQLLTTTGGACTINSTTTMFEHTYDRSIHFAFADLGSRECTVTLTNPTSFTLLGSYRVEILTNAGAWTLDSVTTT